MSLPNNVIVAIQIDQENVNTYRKDAIYKIFKKDKISYEPREDCTPEEVLKGKVYGIHVYQEITCQVIFDMNMDFNLKSIFVANSSKTDAPVALTYSSFVSRDSV